MKCARCLAKIRTRPNALYCPACRDAIRKEKRVARYIRRAEERTTLRDGRRAEITKYIRTERPLIMTDEVQREINRLVDMKYNMSLATKIYSRAEIAAVVRQITPIRHVRMGISTDRVSIFAEPDVRTIFRRESVNEL